MINPSKRSETVSSPIERANELNSPQFENNQGYFSYDLSHAEYLTPRFGEITPSCHIDTVPADRMVMSQASKLILNQINGNFLSTINQYNDTFFVSLRSVFPNNYEKLMVNPVKGDDLPNAAHPVVPLYGLFHEYINTSSTIAIQPESGSEDYVSMYELNQMLDDMDAFSMVEDYKLKFMLGRYATLCNVVSRGQLLDYLGMSLDTMMNFDEYIDRSLNIHSSLQYWIDEFYSKLFNNLSDSTVQGRELKLTEDLLNLSDGRASYYSVTTVSEFRSALSDILERGEFPIFTVADPAQLVFTLQQLRDIFTSIFESVSIESSYLTEVNRDPNILNSSQVVNIGRILAYQQVIAQYYTNDHIDNVFNSDLFMENLRSVMYPTDFSVGFVTTEPVFEYNGRAVEYDYISYGGFWTSLLSEDFDGRQNRQHVWMTLMLLMRRSLRYGDYFATARPNMLAISDQLFINVEDGKVSPIDVTKNLLLQRYLNACNYIGNGYLQYMSSIFGVKPSDTGVIPRFISHRKTVLNSQITNNTSDDQGKQTTNLVGISDNTAMDVFIDDFGYIISNISFDTIPVYFTGIDNTWHFADRFDYFNPNMQNIGDQIIHRSELYGDPSYYNEPFGYTMRNAEYKYKTSKSHGGFVNGLKGFLLQYPLENYKTEYITPDFIRDKPVYLDPIIPQQTGTSPADYYHFIISNFNDIKAARKIQATPAVLF